MRSASVVRSMPEQAGMGEVLRMFGRILWAGLLAAALAAPLGCKSIGEVGADEGFATLSVDEVGQKIGKPDVFVFDGNTAETYAKGHLPGARWIHHDDVKAETMPPNKEATLIFYCKNEH
jgi:hypothetical protein